MKRTGEEEYVCHALSSIHNTHAGCVWHLTWSQDIGESFKERLRMVYVWGYWSSSSCFEGNHQRIRLKALLSCNFCFIVLFSSHVFRSGSSIYAHYSVVSREKRHIIILSYEARTAGGMIAFTSVVIKALVGDSLAIQMAGILCHHCCS